VIRTLVIAASCAVALAAADPGAAKTVLPGFHSPTGNIKCLFIPNPGVLRCQIPRADYAKTLQARCMGPKGEGVDWHGFELTASRKGGVTCSGGILYSPGTQRPSYVNLPYGKTWRQGVFSCRSRAIGVTCRNRTGHGLFVSRQTWRVW
jgi:hypothetical protein